MLSGALRQLFALSEAYPDLKANQNFQQLQAELSDIENKIAAARRFFNNAVQEYNTGIQQFPAVLMAGALRLHAKGILRRRSRRAQGARTGAAGEVLTFRSRVPEPVQRATLAERFTAGPPQTETITGPQRTVACPALALCRARDTRI